MRSLEIRKLFFDFFTNNGHIKVLSSSLIPAHDPTILFTNAGMNQFKDVFLAKETRSYGRAVSIQKCMRAGGKHNDLDNVGFTKRHLTFFEMMGNFSFGDYFKKEAIHFAWDFLTKVIKFNTETLYPSVYKKDDEAYAIWHELIGVPAERIVRLGEADNFWQMGDTGPCGPCSEIYVDRGMEFGCGQQNCMPGCSCDRFLEVWNLVFMQFDRQPDGTDVPLKRVGVDTGMGLERLCALVQQKDSVFLTDLFMPIIHQIEQLSGLVYEKQPKDLKAAFHVLADHIRAATFLIADGCPPSNEGRGYVLRKIIRRATLFSSKLTEKVIFPQLANTVVEQMGDIYPELITARSIVVAVVQSEVEKFATNLIHGQHILKTYMQQEIQSKKISGQQVFKLYDTYGFPVELTELIAQEHGFTVDRKAFEDLMEKQREQSGKKTAYGSTIKIPDTLKTIFIGYEQMENSSTIAALISNNELVSQVKAGEECMVIPHETSFYVECGGQVSDQAIVEVDHTAVPVTHLQKIDGAIGFTIVAPRDLAVGDTIKQVVNKQARLNTMKNHTATHLLQAALIEVLGKQVKQAGSLVIPDYLRFDFTYHENLTAEQIKKVEDIVNAKIQENIPVTITYTTYKDAVNQGVIAFFGDKYNPEQVRVVQVLGFSAELCGGTHVRATGDIGCFKITEVTALSAGQRRLVALTGPQAIAEYQECFSITKTLSQEFKVQQAEILAAIEKQREQYKELLHSYKKLKQHMMIMQLPQLLQQVESINTMPFLGIECADCANTELKELVHSLLSQKSGFYIAVSGGQNNTVSFYLEVAKHYEDSVSINAVRQWLSEQGLKSGGKGLSLQGGGILKTSAAAFFNALKHYLKTK